MSDIGPGGMFDGLDDPAPPAFGADLLPGVLHRGQQLRHQRRMAYAIGSTCAAVLMAGAAIGVAATGGNGSGHVITPTSPTPTQHHTKQPRHHGHTPGAPVGGGQPGGNGHGPKNPPPTCTSPSPSAAETSTPPAPTSTDLPTPTLTESPTTDAATAPAPAPADTSCASPGSTPTETPAPTVSPTASYPPLPLLSEGAQPVGGIAFGIW